MVAGGRQLGLFLGTLVLALAPALAGGTGPAWASGRAGASPKTAHQPQPSFPAPAQPTSPAPRQGASPTVSPLSNEQTHTTWANPVAEVAIRARPTPRSQTVARSHLATEDGYPEVYLLLATLTDSHGRVWIRMRIPGRPNGRIGWIPRDALGEFHVTRWLIVIGLGGHWLRAYYGGKLRHTAPAGVGKPGTPTPAGRFWIRERFSVSDRGNPYWPYAFGTSDYSRLTDWPGGGVVGIHGDFGEPQLIPGAPSHGCVRLHAADLMWLARHVQLGTPIHIIR